MKAFIKGRWFPLVVAVVGTVIIAFVMALFGWRITYAPELETSWECVSAIASLIGAVGTVAAVWFAIRVADKQNKIALFEKRHDVFDMLACCKTFADMIKSAKCKTDVRQFFLMSFCKYSENDRVEDMDFITSKYVVVLDVLRKSQFILNSDVTSYIQSLTKLLLVIVRESVIKTDNDTMNDEMQSAIHSYMGLMAEDIYQGVLNTMAIELTLK